MHVSAHTQHLLISKKEYEEAMNLKAVAAVAAFAAIGAPAIALAAAAPTGAPIEIVDSQVQPANVGADLYQQGEVRFAFVNRANVPATEVQFAVTSNGRPIGVYTDVGTFAPGVEIDKFFTTQELSRHQDITVAKVTFADGTTWSSDEATPAARRQAELQ